MLLDGIFFSVMLSISTAITFNFGVLQG